MAHFVKMQDPSGHGEDPGLQLQGTKQVPKHKQFGSGPMS